VTAAAPLASEAPAAGPVRAVCPHCRRPLVEAAAHRTCPSCARAYSRHHGILDLRVFADPYLDFDEDRARADRVVAALEALSLPELLEHYWSLSASTPLPMRAGFVRSALRAPLRARRILDLMAADGVPLPRSRILEVGSGTGGFLLEGAAGGAEVTGIDIAMRWLHVSRRRFREAGRGEPDLVCACAERLPFEDGVFDAVVALGILEFVRDAGAVLAECARVLRPGGRAYLTSANRYAPGPEPHVGLWGVGWLPRAWQAGYVRARGRGDFANVRLLSYRDLAAAADLHFERSRIDPAVVPAEVRRALRGPTRAGAAVYSAWIATRAGRAALRPIAPEWEATLTKAG